MPTSLYQLDFNLLKILHSLVKTGNTLESARVLGISQTSVSRALGKLREEFGSQLFLRRPHGLEPSPLARELAGAVEQMFGPLQRVMAQHQQFDPAQYRGDLRLVIERGLLPALGPRLTLHLADKMPLVNFNVSGWGEDAIPKLLSGDYHYGIQSGLAELPKRLHTPQLLEDNLVSIARRDHPGLAKQNWLSELERYPLVSFYLPSIITLDTSPVEQVSKRWGLDSRMLLKTDDIHTLVAMLKHKDAILLAASPLLSHLDPELVAYPFPELSETDGAAYIPTGLGRKGEVVFSGAYSATFRDQPLHRFLDQEIRAQMREMQHTHRASCKQ